MKTHTNFSRVFAWVMAFVMVFSLAAIPAAADEGTYSAELVLSGEGVDASGKLILDSNQALLGLLANASQNGQTLLDAGIYWGSKLLAVDSPLIGGAYGIDLTTVKENLPNSIFAPDSGTPYALEQEQYDMVLALLNGELPLVQEQSQAQPEVPAALQEAAMVLVGALTEPMLQAAGNLVIEQATVVETINGTDIEASRVSVTADGAAILGFLEAFITTTQGSHEVQDALTVFLEATNIGPQFDTTGAELVQQLVENGDQFLEELRAELFEEPVSITGAVSLSNATQNPVKFSLALKDDVTDLVFNVLIGEALDFFRLEMLEDGQMGETIQFEMKEDDASRMTFKLSILDAEVEQSSLALALDNANQTFLVTMLSEGETSSVSGFFTKEENLFSLTVDQLDEQAFGGTVTLNLRSDDTLSLPTFSDIITMSEAEFAALVELAAQLSQTFSQMAA